MRVILASRYGTWLPRRWGSESARMTLPRASKPVLMWTDSLRRKPVFPVRAARSDPARSTRWSLEERTEPSSWLCCRLEPSRTLFSHRHSLPFPEEGMFTKKKSTLLTSSATMTFSHFGR
uniref:Uncharacterized protein n=1 Tax=Salmo trutta TaxID=8032 RepID=A0A673Y8M9_SALTR